MYEDTRTYDVRLVGGEQPILAHIVVHVLDWSARNRRHRICTITLTSPHLSMKARAYSVYHAFQKLRLKLERYGLTPDCYGSCANVRASGMQLDMGDGTYAYRMTSRPDREHEVVNIFETEPGLKLGTVAQQRAFFDETRRGGWAWFVESIRSFLGRRS